MREILRLATMSSRLALLAMACAHTSALAGVPDQDVFVTGVDADYVFADAVVHLAGQQGGSEELEAFDELVTAIAEDGEVAGYEKRLLAELLALKHPATLTYFHYSTPYADLLPPSDALRARIQVYLDSID